jgi:Fe-S-cluster containining protein
MTDPHVCARCAHIGDTCCRLSPGEEALCFPLSEAEKNRILDCAEGVRGVFVVEPNSGAFLGNVKKLFPGEEKLVRAAFPENKFHLRLATDTSGNCLLLSDEGCMLPREARPYYCRLYPFWSVDGKLTLMTSSRCLLQREAPSFKGIMDGLGMQVSTVLELYGRLRLAWGLPPKKGLPPVTPPFIRSVM